MNTHRSKPSATTEDYLKAIFELASRNPKEIAPMGEIARVLKITPGTVTTMIRRLSEDGLLTYRPRVGCSLTAEGQYIALRTLRRHRILETFLVQSLGMDWSEVHIEAEKMEHGISDSVVDRLWTFLGCPARDPHGGIIPDQNLETGESPADRPLNEINDGDNAVLTRLPDRNPDLLKTLQDAGLAPGTEFVMERSSGTGSLRVLGPDGSVSFSLEVASAIRAKPVD